MRILNRFRFYKSILTKDMDSWARHGYAKFNELNSLLQPYTGELKNKVILDVGCGQMYAQSLLLHNSKNNVVGIDSAPIVVNGRNIMLYLNLLRHGDLQYLARAILYQLLLKNRSYYRTLRELSGLPLTNSGLDIRRMNVEEMSFDDNVFDIAISLAVFEHILDVPKAISELYRVLKPNGVTYINIHLFRSLSGGHHPDYLDQNKVPPWDHLRENRCKFPIYLNKYTEHEYISMFATKFQILEVINVGVGEGSDFLTPKIQAEFSSYSKEELLKRGITIIARKPLSTTSLTI